jgi:uncharacterized membrane protein SpoIIM required for sporulation
VIAEVASAFGLGLAVDVCWVELVHATREHRPFHAAAWSMVIALLGFVVIALMAETTWYLAVPATLGHGVGTFVAVERGRVARQTGTMGPTS